MSEPANRFSNLPLDPGSVVEALPSTTRSLVPDRPSEPAITDAEMGTARRYADASRAASTKRAYQSDWRRFSTWCAARNLNKLPADPRVVAVFLAAEAETGSAPLTIGRRLAAIGWMHRRAGLQPRQKREGAAAILEVIAGIRRSHGVAPVKKHAADADVLRDVLRAIVGDDLRSMRDRALLAFGMAGAFRRSELVALRVSDIEWVKEGLRVTIRRGKTDQEGAGATIAIPEGRRLRPKAPPCCMDPTSGAWNWPNVGGSPALTLDIHLAVQAKLNQNRRHLIPKQKYKVMNSAAYDAALRQRGSLTVWFTDEAVAAWRAVPRTSSGGQRWYSGIM